eukprot:gnl/TRDRNA2_/TRDRNA2_177930_c0_seq1.p1 gnl/TRDRNA2_/TRDRNA2_177930_c0~~gnl/TRDRNA2_/TRDRNA2_177930_c0_seq1.p1  ORF type:complete len:556 (-),score=-18.69 gnl/TRDRNA2_/TRDRNA2_177930_c0_seq1:1444-3111(-)
MFITSSSTLDSKKHDLNNIKTINYANIKALSTIHRIKYHFDNLITIQGKKWGIRKDELFNKKVQNLKELVKTKDGSNSTRLGYMAKCDHIHPGNIKNHTYRKIFKSNRIHSKGISEHDTAKIYLQAGNGGNGCVAIRREKFVPNGGPIGGNGGLGGSVWAEAYPHLSSLYFYKNKTYIRAESGGNGGTSLKSGVDGRDVTILVPCGTTLRRRDSKEWETCTSELIKPGQREIQLRGGAGGRGNAHFKKIKGKMRVAEKGQIGQAGWFQLDLKTIADVGIVGVPNAGKSTLLSAISSAQPSVGHYAFSTTKPGLGVCRIGIEPMVFVDLPGILTDAHLGRGMGHNFLRHCERCRLLIHVVDGTSKDPMKDLHATNAELEIFDPELAKTPQVLGFNKMDLKNISEYFSFTIKCINKVYADNPVPFSASSKKGLIDLLRKVRNIMEELKPDEETKTRILKKQTRFSNTSTSGFHIKSLPKKIHGRRAFAVTGRQIEIFTRQINSDCPDSVVCKLQNAFKKSGIIEKLKKMGLRDGEIVVIGKLSVKWSNDDSDISFIT